MGRAASLLCVLLCAAFFTAGCASPAPVSLAWPLGPSDRAAAVVPSAAQARRRGLKWKGEVHEKYAAVLIPTIVKKKIIGDGYGRVVYKVVSYSKHEWYFATIAQVFDIHSGGEEPTIAYGTSCDPKDLVGSIANWKNTTTMYAASKGKFSFELFSATGPVSKQIAEHLRALQFRYGKFVAVSHANNKRALCGELKKIDGWDYVWGNP